MLNFYGSFFYINNNNNNNNSKTIFMVLSSWQSHRESSTGSFDECRTAPSGRRPKTKPDDLGCESGWTGCQSLHPPSPFILLLSPKADTHFTVPRRVEGWVNLVGWLHTEMVYRPQTVTHFGTDRVWRSATTFIEANALSLSQTAKMSSFGMNTHTETFVPVIYCVTGQTTL